MSRPELSNLSKFLDDLKTYHLERMVREYCEECGYYERPPNKLYIPKDLFNMIVAKDSGLTIKVNEVQLQFDKDELSKLGYEDKITDYLASWLKTATELEKTKQVEIVSCTSSWALEVLEKLRADLHLEFVYLNTSFLDG